MEDKIPSNSRMVTYSGIIGSIEMERIANRDLMFAVGSIMFVYIYLSCHLRSLFLGSMSILSILFSFSITLVITRLIF